MRPTNSPSPRLKPATAVVEIPPSFCTAEVAPVGEPVDELELETSGELVGTVFVGSVMVSVCGTNGVAERGGFAIKVPVVNDVANSEVKSEILGTRLGELLVILQNYRKESVSELR